MSELATEVKDSAAKRLATPGKLVASLAISFVSAPYLLESAEDGAKSYEHLSDLVQVVSTTLALSIAAGTVLNETINRRRQ